MFIIIIIFVIMINNLKITVVIMGILLVMTNTFNQEKFTVNINFSFCKLQI